MPLVLVTDDNDESRYMLEVLLQRNGFETVTATNGKEALEIAKLHRPDLIISDILMPVMDGFALCKAWKSADELKQIPFIFYSATYTDPRDIEFGLSLGADRYLVKPQDIELLLQVFRDVLASSGKGTPPLPEASFEEEMEFLRHYNEALFRKLEKKMSDLEATNRSLQGEIEKRQLTEKSLRASEEKLQMLLESLQKAHDELEERVKERTAELERSHERVMEEVEERERLETQLHQAQKMQAIGTLAGGIAHDFNNILAAILGNAELAMDEVDPDNSLYDNLDQIVKSSVRARELIRQILTFSRRSEQKHVPLRLIPLIEDTFKLLRASMPATVQMVLNVAVQDDTIIGNEAQLQQVLMNLVTNAKQAIEDNGTIEISLLDASMAGHAGPEVLRTDDYALISVKDSGTGMDETIRARMFEPFFTTRETGQGTGLGLSVVYGIVANHEGFITVESAPGKGSNFRVFLPKSKVAIQAVGEAGETLPGGTERILFVDDEEALQNLTKKRLSRLGYAVTTSPTAEKALQLFNKNPAGFDAVITDQTMPGDTGLSLAKKLLQIRPDLPIILCTGYSEGVNEDVARQVGIREFLLKPITKKDLAQTVRRVLDSRNSK